MTLKQARRVAIFVVGATVALLGLVMLLTPGPGMLLILGGLAILAVEFAWARRLLADAKARMHTASKALRKRTGLGGGQVEGGPSAELPSELPAAGKPPAGPLR